jgi:hypothetical protein
MSKRRNYKKEYRRRLQLRELREQQLAAAAKPRKSKRRNYKKEYQVRKYKRLKTSIQEQTRAEKRRIFGKVVKRTTEFNPGEFEETLQEKKRRPERDWQFTDETEFINAMVNLGLTSKDAYTMWFS